MKGRCKRVEICGGIASGKTTLARLLRRAQLHPIFENFRANPFYLSFYRDPVGTAFETEITFLLQHYHQQKVIAGSRHRFCSDFSLVLDHAYACVTLPRGALTLFRSILNKVESNLPPRTLLIQLECSPEIELQRIRHRHRHAERAIKVDYLEEINKALASRIRRLSRTENLLVIDSGTVDFAHDQSTRNAILRRVTQALRTPRT